MLGGHFVVTDTLPERAVIEFALDQHGARLASLHQQGVFAEIEFSLGVGPIVTFEATGREQRGNLSIEVDRVGSLDDRREEEQKEAEGRRSDFSESSGSPLLPGEGLGVRVRGRRSHG
jgi:hypothetical protein